MRCRNYLDRQKTRIFEGIRIFLTGKARNLLMNSIIIFIKTLRNQSLIRLILSREVVALAVKYRVPKGRELK